nr:hypothetical protein [Brevibacterium sp. UCMA 11754]
MVAPWGEQYEGREALPRQPPAVLDGNRSQGRNGERQRPEELLVTDRVAYPHSKGEYRAEPLGDLSAAGVSEDHVRAKRQMAAVVLERPEWHDHRRVAGVDLPPQLARGEHLQLVHAQIIHAQRRHAQDRRPD